jgi:hypothetical protein
LHFPERVLVADSLAHNLPDMNRRAGLAFGDSAVNCWSGVFHGLIPRLSKGFPPCLSFETRLNSRLEIFARTVVI